MRPNLSDLGLFPKRATSPSRKFSTSNAQRPTSNAQRTFVQTVSAYFPWTLGVESAKSDRFLAPCVDLPRHFPYGNGLFFTAQEEFKPEGWQSPVECT